VQRAILLRLHRYCRKVMPCVRKNVKMENVETMNVKRDMPCRKLRVVHVFAPEKDRGSPPSMNMQ
jgi:hypothetical protein